MSACNDLGQLGTKVPQPPTGQEKEPDPLEQGRGSEQADARLRLARENLNDRGLSGVLDPFADISNQLLSVNELEPR